MYWRCGAGLLNCWCRSSWLGRRVCGRWSFGECWINAERFAGAINAAKGWIAGIRLSELRIVQDMDDAYVSPLMVALKDKFDVSLSILLHPPGKDTLL